jgi:hypothetical protein
MGSRSQLVPFEGGSAASSAKSREAGAKRRDRGAARRGADQAPRLVHLKVHNRQYQATLLALFAGVSFGSAICSNFRLEALKALLVVQDDRAKLYLVFGRRAVK